MFHSMIWAAVAISSTYLIARSVLLPVAGAIATALAVLGAHGFWVFATQLEVYVPSVGCTTAATALLFTSRPSALTTTRLIAVSTLWALATLYHLGNVFFFIPLCAFFYSTQGWSGWRQCAMISALAGTAVLATFVAASYWVLGHERWSVEAFLAWVFEITNRPLTNWGTASNWWEPHMMMGGVWAQIKTLTLLPEYFPFGQRPLWIVGSLVVGGSLLWNAIQVVRLAPQTGARVFFLLLFGTNFLFFTWWSPYVYKFFIPASVPLIMLIGLTVNDVYAGARSRTARRMVAGGAACAIAVMFAFNSISVLELRHSYGPDYAEAEILNRLAPGDCRIYAAGFHLNALAVYFNRVDNVMNSTLEREFYRVATGRSSAGREMFAGEKCALIPLGFLSEAWYRTVMDGYFDTGTWPEYIAYFFDVRPSSGGGGITYDGFELVSEGDGPPHVLVDRGRRVHGASLDQLTEIISTEVKRTVQRYAAKYPMLEQGDALLAAVPRADIEMRRLRGYIFGYSFGDKVRRISRPGDPADRSEAE
jgi:hypothetical protein